MQLDSNGNKSLMCCSATLTIGVALQLADLHNIAMKGHICTPSIPLQQKQASCSAR